MVRLFVSSFTVMMAGTGCGFLLHLFLAKILSADGYGVYNFILSITMIISLIALFGLPSGVVRFIAGYLESEDERPKIRQLIRFSILFTSVLGILLGAIIYAGLYFTGFADEYPVAALLAGFVMVPVTVWQRLNSGILRGFHKTTLSVAYETLFRELGLLLVVVALYAGGVHLSGGDQALWLMTGVMVLIILFSQIQIERETPPGQQTAEKGQWKSWLIISAPMMLTVAFQRIMKRIDLIFIGIMLGPASTGIYALMIHFADGATIASKSALAVFSPKAAAAYSANDLKALKHIYKLALVLVCASTITFAVLEILLVPYILPLIGETYMEGFNALLIILGWYIIATLFGPASNLMIMSNYERPAMWITMLSAFLNIVLNPAFIYLYGIEGAAFVTGFVVALRNALSAAYVYRKGLLSDKLSA